MKPTTVVCSCGWRGRRAHRSCECYEHPYNGCSPYGKCPKCGLVLDSVEHRRREREAARRVAAIDWSSEVAP